MHYTQKWHCTTQTASTVQGHRWRVCCTWKRPKMLRGDSILQSVRWHFHPPCFIRIENRSPTSLRHPNKESDVKCGDLGKTDSRKPSTMLLKLVLLHSGLPTCHWWCGLDREVLEPQLSAFPTIGGEMVPSKGLRANRKCAWKTSAGSINSVHFPR